MIKNLWKRFTYVEIIKRMTMEEGSEAIPYATARDLATAYNLYPHRREVPFILARMARLLSFDDETSNYNTFKAAFLSHIEIDQIIEKYKEKDTLTRYEGALDPIIFLARLKVEANYTKDRNKGLEEAVELLDTYRKDDELARLYKFIYKHEILQSDREKNICAILMLRDEITDFLNRIKSAENTEQHIRIVTSHVFQEVLDHYAQLHIDIAIVNKNIADAARFYARILTTRQQIANASEVPWLEGPGKLSIYQYFKHQVGRESNYTRKAVEEFAQVPNLQEGMKRIADADAFKEYRNLETWDRGTPLSSSFSGRGMHNKLVEWLKSGW